MITKLAFSKQSISEQKLCKDQKVSQAELFLNSEKFSFLTENVFCLMP